MRQTVVDCEAKISKDCRKDMLVDELTAVAAKQTGMKAMCPECADYLHIQILFRQRAAGVVFMSPFMFREYMRRQN